MIERPPAVEPVKPTWSTRPDEIALAVASCDMVRAWNTPSGSPALAKHWAKCSATSAVWLECFITTVLPARIAGSTAFSAVM